jgi:hypothetical protein
MVPAAAITSTMTQSPLALVFMLTRLASRVGVNNRLEGNALEIIAAMISDDQ